LTPEDFIADLLNKLINLVVHVGLLVIEKVIDTEIFLIIHLQFNQLRALYFISLIQKWDQLEDLLWIRAMPIQQLFLHDEFFLADQLKVFEFKLITTIRKLFPDHFVLQNFDPVLIANTYCYLEVLNEFASYLCASRACADLNVPLLQAYERLEAEAVEGKLLLVNNHICLVIKHTEIKLNVQQSRRVFVKHPLL